MMAVTSDSCQTFPDGEGSQEMSEDVNREIIIRFIPPTFGLGSKRKELSEIHPSAAVSTCSIAPVTVQASRVKLTAAATGHLNSATPACQSPESRSCTPLQDEHILDLSLRKDTPVRPGKLYTASIQPVLVNTTRAANLLEKGCMPLLPPARRERQDDTVITILTGTSRLLWPPKN
ncbi:hypothetical protein ACJMK2_009559 [Sinanodonta woodiana]|uniref:Uncharacterized protein n=1 Tax=Sinanodonta woodiana TaxID=1069815 RepID=A0ABD3VCL1_SINWO